jgi:hypothetical protein
VRRWQLGGKFMKSMYSNGFSTFTGLVRWLKAGLTWNLWGRHPRSAHLHVYALLPIRLPAGESIHQ